MIKYTDWDGEVEPTDEKIKRLSKNMMQLGKKEDWSILYLRPDGWWVAGTGFKDEKEAKKCAKDQLPDYVRWTAVNTESIVVSDENYEDGEGKVITKVPGVLDS